MPHADVVIIGAGAAGLFCAITAGKRGRSVILADHADKLGKKILISGGGRCNFTNLMAGPDNFISDNPHFCKSALARFKPGDFIEMIERHAIAYHEKTLGQLFCDVSAKQIVAMLLDECANAGVQIISGCRIDSVAKNDRFTLSTSTGEITGDKLVIATGGLSIPAIGATDFGYRIARQFQLKMAATAPALVPFTLPEQGNYSTLSGVSVDAVVRTQRREFREAILFTHAGLSGPAILQASSYWRDGEALTINLLPDHDVAEILTRAKAAGVKALAVTVLSAHLPKRLVERWFASIDRRIADRTVAHLSTSDIAAIAGAFHAWTIIPSGTEGYSKAEVTRGGVDTAELSSQTMGSRRVPGLYFIGEVVDVTGWLGGYNFQWAWASGHAAGCAV
jgi:predicted Rossmann fold flavoprotein